MDIAESIATFLDEHPTEAISFERERFLQQAERMLDVHWQTLALPDDFSEILGSAGSLADQLPPDEDTENGYRPRRAVDTLVDVAGKCPPQYPLHATNGWGILNAAIAWLHDGSKSLRKFDGWREGRWQAGKAFNKDSLNGKEEAVLSVSGTAGEVASWCGKELEVSQGSFKPGELLGASTLLKRLWYDSWLIREGGLDCSGKEIREAMPMPNTRAVAQGMPFSQGDKDGHEESGSDRYFAILALDGDEMGKWISGSKAPNIGECLSPKAFEYYSETVGDLLEKPRAVTPSSHLQFSEALGNFALHAAQRTVEAFNGRLIYAGGDDVLAMLPATEALACARALRAAFRGESALSEMALGKVVGEGASRASDRCSRVFDTEHVGYIRLHPDSGAVSGDEAGLLSDPVKFHALVPGPASDVSAGIAIAHFKSPLQDAVKAARLAEKRAKRDAADGGLGRSAVAISLLKHSGEILEWGCKWGAQNAEEGSFGFRLLETLTDSLKTGKLSTRFPHKLEGLLRPYTDESASTTLDPAFAEGFEDILALELEHCLTRDQGGKLPQDARDLFSGYWRETAGPGLSDRIQSLINLLRTAAWMSRTAPSESKGQPHTA